MSKKVFDDIKQGLEEAIAYVRGEPNGCVVHVVPSLGPDVAGIRKALKLSRPKFADRFGLDARAIQDWEQGRRVPDRAARILLRVIALDPAVVEKAALDAKAAFEEASDAVAFSIAAAADPEGTRLPI